VDGDLMKNLKFYIMYDGLVYARLKYASQLFLSFFFISRSHLL